MENWLLLPRRPLCPLPLHKSPKAGHPSFLLKVPKFRDGGAYPATGSPGTFYFQTVSSGKFTFPNLGFLICKVGMIKVPTSVRY